jgi:hypothetical protein
MNLEARSQPVKEASTDFELARLKLQLSTKPDELPCRENEYLEILCYVGQALDTQTGTCICK